MKKTAQNTTLYLEYPVIFKFCDNAFLFLYIVAPRNTETITTVGQNETSITLDWKKVDDILKYILVFSRGNINVTASAGDETVTCTISGLTSGTKYDFSLFALFENVRSSGVNYTEVTGNVFLLI